MARFTRKDFLDALFQDYFREREGFIMVKSSRPTDQKTSIRYFPNIEILAKEPYQFDQHVFFGVCPREKMRAEKNHIRYLVALWAGLDLDPEGYSGKHTHFFGHSQAAKAIRSFPLPPSIVVESGRGVHLYWLLKEVTPIADADAVERLLGTINSYFQCKSEVGIDSMLRLPDTSNAKVSSAPTECRVKYLNPDFRYDLIELEQLNLEAAVSLGKNAGGKSSKEGTPDFAVAAHAQQAIAAGTKLHIGEEFREDMTHLGFYGDVLRHGESQIGYKKTLEGAGQKRAALSLSEPDFEPTPYEQAGRRPSASLQPQSVGAPSTDVLDRMADKLADKIAEKLAAKLVDQIVDKVVERLKAPR
jgi:hypothetical protein